jgi:pimeloyl-ACP methyl ester carboxylesterase
MTTSIGSLQNVPVRFCKTEDGAHIAYVVIGPSDHVAATAVVEQAAGKAPKRKSKMRSTRSVTTPLVLLPGLGMLKEDWADFAFELSKSRLCVMADYRGLGDSMLPNQPPNMEGGKFVPSCSLQNWLTPPQLDIFFESTRTTKLPRLATDVLEIVRDLFWAKHAHGGKAWKRFNLLGHGMGGAVAQTVSLVVMSGSPFENVAFTSNFDPEDPRKEGMGIEHLVLLGASARAVNQGYGGGVFEALSKDDLGEVGALMGYGQDKEQVTAMWRTGRRPRVVIGGFSEPEMIAASHCLINVRFYALSFGPPIEMPLCHSAPAI